MYKAIATLLSALICVALSAQQPEKLITDLMEKTESEFAGGLALIRSSHPSLSWTYPEGNNTQRAYRILVASSPELLRQGKADLWDSGAQRSAQQAVIYDGKALSPDQTYYWSVKTKMRRGGWGKYSAAKAFTTAELLDSEFSYYPLDKTFETATLKGELYDFGKAAFAQLSLRLTASSDADTAIVRLGEHSTDGEIFVPTGRSNVRYAEYKLPLRKGSHDYQLELRKDKRNSEQNPANNESGVLPILMPERIGEVFPFRYVQVKGAAEVQQVTRHSVHIPFDDDASHFESSDSVLNQVWELCKHSIKATSFTGIYVDGDRERIPYEADALVNQLSHYAVDAEFTMARRSTAHLILNPTWPTEWILITPTLAWLDYLNTGDLRLLEQYFNQLEAKALLPLREANGLISTKTGKTSAEVLASVNFKGRRIKDIVDWPQSGAAGIEKEAGGEADGHVMCEFNTVVNAYHYEALSKLAMMAEALGNEQKAAYYRDEAASVRKAVNTLLFDQQRGIYIDGVGTEHSSQHANMFPLAFGMVPEEHQQSVTEFIKSRGMACSVYGAQFLLDALYDRGEAEYALSLLNSTGLRSWYNMIRMGSTITTEAWDNVYKPNLDWNHAWGAVPANVIVRGLMGVEPLEPGYSKVRIAPQPGGLEHAELRLATIKGEIRVAFQKEKDGSYTLDVQLPANMQAEIINP